MMNKTIGIIVGFVIVAGGAFYAGMQYQTTKSTISSQQQNTGARGINGFDRNGNIGNRGGGTGQGGLSSGEIISKDDTSVTVKLRDGGSKIIFYSPSTSIMKSDSGTIEDLVVGQQITANGTQNTDGSITAQSIQIRPAQAPRPIPTMVPGAKEFTISGSNYSFSPAEMKVKKGDTVRITFKNSGGFHDLKIDEFNIATAQLQSGEEQIVQFVADKTGTFEYYCSVGQHRAMGMKGNLIVE